MRHRVERRACHDPYSHGLPAAARGTDGRHSDPQPHRHGHLRHQYKHRADGSWERSSRAKRLDIDFQFECWLTPQHYTVTVATQYSDGSSHDWLDDVLSFEVLSRRQAAGRHRSARERGDQRWRSKTPAMKARLTLKVRAGARKTGFAVSIGDAWKLHVAAPPVDGKANEAIVRFLAQDSPACPAPRRFESSAVSPGRPRSSRSKGSIRQTLHRAILESNGHPPHTGSAASSKP